MSSIPGTPVKGEAKFWTKGGWPHNMEKSSVYIIFKFQ